MSRHTFSVSSVPRSVLICSCWIGLVYSACNSLNCPVTPPIGTEDDCYEKSLIVPPVNQTVYEGQSIIVYAEADSSCNIQPIVDNCPVDQSLYFTNTTGNITHVIFPIANVSVSEHDGYCITLYVVSKKGSITCDHTACVDVIGPPSLPINLTVVPTCTGVLINGTLPPYTTVIIVEMAGQIYNFTKLPIHINVSEYRKLSISITAGNPAGDSDPCTHHINFVNFTQVTVTSSVLYIQNNGIPSVNISLRFNRSCPTSVPKVLKGFSNCLPNRGKVIDIIVSEEDQVMVPLISDRMNCFFTIESGVNTIPVLFNQSTYSIQSVHISRANSTGYFTVNCTLLPGGTGYAIKIYNETGFVIFADRVPLNTSCDCNHVVGTHLLTANGNYTIKVFTLARNGRRSNLVATGVVEVNSYVPPSPSPDTNCTANCSNSSQSGTNWKVIIGSSTAAVVMTIGIIIGIVIVVVLCLKKRKNYPVSKRTTDTEMQPPIRSTNQRGEHPSQDPLLGNDNEDGAYPQPHQPHTRSPPTEEYETLAEHDESTTVHAVPVTAPVTIPVTTAENEDEVKKVELDTEQDEGDGKRNVLVAVPHSPPNTDDPMIVKN